MTPLLFPALLLLIPATCGAIFFLARLRALEASQQTQVRMGAVDRYRPMLRLLSDEDLDFVKASGPLRAKLRAKRRELFRGYLRCLTKDYGRLLAGVSVFLVQSHVDRPDLSRALARNKMLFAVALCRIELRLWLHAFGIGKVEVAGLVDALEMLRGQMRTLSLVPSYGTAAV